MFTAAKSSLINKVNTFTEVRQRWEREREQSIRNVYDHVTMAS